MSERIKASRSIGPGEHACSFYRNAYHQLSITVPYLRAAILRNERCVYLLDDTSEENVVDAMTSIGFDLYPVIKRRQLTFHPIWETHFRGGGFDPQHAIAFYTERLQETAALGYRGLAIAGTIASSLRPSAQAAVVEYERTVANHFAGMAISAICLYHEDLFSRSFLAQIQAAHPVEAVNQCPYFVNFVRECDVDRTEGTPADQRRMMLTFCSNANFDRCPVYHRMTDPLLGPAARS